MAFMMPVMKNNYDIYKDTRARSRKTSECSNVSSGNGTTTLSSALGTPGQSSNGAQRRRKPSECKSESFAISPSHGQLGTHRTQMQRCHSSRGFTRNASRSSHASIMQMSQNIVSPTRSSPPSRTQTASALERQAAAQAAAQSTAAAAAATTAAQEEHGKESSNDFTKFHLRLVNKLRKSFRKDSGKHS